MVCRLVEVETNLGRSLVYDFLSKSYKQIDHRAVDYIIFQNKKYSKGVKKGDFDIGIEKG